MRTHHSNIKLYSYISLLLTVVLASAVEAVPPRVVEMTPSNGDKNVDPGLKRIIIKFDQDMDLGGFSICGGGPDFPPSGGRTGWSDRRTLIMPVRLSPNHDYQFSVNCPSFQNCRSRRGESAIPYPVHFRTAASSESSDGSANSQPVKNKKLSFTLFDTFGREVHAEDYLGSVLLIDVGACWCGGCQQGAAPLLEFASEYAEKGLQTIRLIAGDGDLPSLDFQRHYRLPFVHLLDCNRVVEKQYNPDGWPFYMIVDAEGNIVRQSNAFVHTEQKQVRPILDRLLSKTQRRQSIERDGIQYMPDTLKRSKETAKAKQIDRFPSIVCGADGKVYVVFTTNRNGNDDVYLRVYDGGQWQEDIPVAATDAQEYDATVMLDRNNVLWVCWTSNAGGDHYNIYVKRALDDTANQEMPRTEQVTQSSDDAMHGRMACDSKGRIWVTYYQWEKMNGMSRDKEVYVRRRDAGRWSEPVHVSPSDVPQYEDHTDPAIAAIGDGVLICWCWDFHQPKGYPKTAKDPSVFVRAINGAMQTGPIQAISGQQVDADPAILCHDQTVWFGWNSWSYSRQQGQIRKAIFVRDLMGMSGTEPVRLAENVVNVCPCDFSVSQGGDIALLWSETLSENQWQIRQSILDREQNRWSPAKTIVSKGNPRFGVSDYDEQHRLWVAYSAETDHGREIVVQKF